MCGNVETKPLSFRQVTRKARDAKARFVVAQKRRDQYVTRLAATQVYEDLIRDLSQPLTGWDLSDAIRAVKSDVRTTIMSKVQSRKRF